MTIQEALAYLENAHFENYSGQIIAEHQETRKDYIAFDLTCTCNEVPNKVADEVGEALITLLNGARATHECAERMDAAIRALIAEWDTGRYDDWTIHNASLRRHIEALRAALPKEGE
jgi:hypothetical protein